MTAPGLEQGGHRGGGGPRGEAGAIEGERSKRLVLVCALAVVASACCIGFLETSGGDGGSALEVRHGGVELLAKGSHFQAWYREQTADRWFGSNTFEGKDVSGRQREKGKWVEKAALKLIPQAEREHADRKLKGRLVQLAMTNLMDKQKYHHIEQELVQKAGTYGYHPELSEGTMSEPEVHAVVHHLLIQWLNHTTFGINVTAESGTTEESPAEVERKAREQREKDAAEKKLDVLLKAASPKLKQEYDDEVKQHEEQNKKWANHSSCACSDPQRLTSRLPCRMDTVATLLKSLTATKGYTSADIAQCGDHQCDEVVNPSPAAMHAVQEVAELKALKKGRRRL